MKYVEHGAQLRALDGPGLFASSRTVPLLVPSLVRLLVRLLIRLL